MTQKNERQFEFLDSQEQQEGCEVGDEEEDLEVRVSLQLSVKELLVHGDHVASSVEGRARVGVLR